MISVVIPVRNRETLVGRAVRSVLAQTYRDFEVIIVDDHSTDGTLHVISQVSAADSRVKILSTDSPSGAQTARNFGIRASKRPWIAFLDSDDEWMPDKLEQQQLALNRAGARPLTVVSTGYEVIGEDGQVKNTVNDLPDGADSYESILRGSRIILQSILTSRLALERIGLLDENVPAYQEWDTAIGLAKICSFVAVRKALVRYHRHGGPTISDDQIRALSGFEYIVEKHWQSMKDCGDGTVWLHHLIAHGIRSAEQGLWERARSLQERLELSRAERERVCTNVALHRMQANGWRDALLVLREPHFRASPRRAIVRTMARLHINPRPYLGMWKRFRHQLG